MGDFEGKNTDETSEIKKRKKNKRKQKKKRQRENSDVAFSSSHQQLMGTKRKFDEIDTGDDPPERFAELDSKLEKGKKDKDRKKKRISDNQSNNTSTNGSFNADQQQEDEIIYPYDVQSDDHCETPIEAYEDICCFLNYIAEKLQKPHQNLLIYDPFYCEGSMVERMATLGYSNVYNRKEDFYQIQANGTVPDYDILLTNPPYSQDHMERLLQFCTQSRKPFALLVPNYVYTKDYFQRISGTSQIFFVVPSQGRRYLYTTPKGRRQKKSSKYTSPFPTFWFCHIPPSFPFPATGPINPRAPPFIPPAIIQQAKQQSARIELARSAHEIPLSVRTKSNCINTL